MSNVTLTIGGRGFAVSCADGEEAHVEQLGRLIDNKAASAGVAGQSESRMLLFAALLLADDLHNTHKRLRELDAAPVPATGHDPALATRLTAIAGRMENLADLLETGT